MTHCGGAQTRNDSEHESMVYDLDTHAQAQETGKVPVWLVTAVPVNILSAILIITHRVITS